MTTTKLKSFLVNRISKIDDIEFLNAIKIIIESKENNDSIYNLNSVQRKKIRKSKLKLKNGYGVSNEKAFDEIDKWLKEK